MQTMLKVLDIGSVGNMADVNAQKIAIRMNSDDGAISSRDEAGFMKCLKKYLSTADDQEVKSSLEELEWIPLDGDGGLTPVIDFTDGAENISSLEALIKSFYDADSDPTLSASGWAAIGAENEGLADAMFAEVNPDMEIEKQLAAAAGDAAGDVLKTDMMDQFQKTMAMPGQEGEEKNLPSSFNQLIQSQSQSHPDDGVPSENQPSALDGIQPAPGEKSTSEQDAAALKPDLNATLSSDRKPSEEMVEEALSTKSGEAAISQKPVENPQTGPSAQSFQMTGKEKEAMQPTHPTEKQDTQAFQRMFADNDASSGGDASASFQNGASNGGNPDFQHHLSTESQTGAEAQLHAMDSKSPDAVQSAESSNTQPAQKTMEDDVIRQIVQRMTLRNSGDQSRMTIQLKPEFLGNLKLEITTENQHVAIKMTAESSTVKEMIEHNISVLRTELQQHKLNVDKIDVYVGQDSQSSEQQQQEAASWQERQESMHRLKNMKTVEKQNEQPVETIEENTAANRKTRSSEIDFFA